MSIQRIAEAIAGLESGGNYSAVSKPSPNGDVAYGKYQIMGNNIPVWTKEVLNTSMTPDQFLNDPKAQDAVAQKKIGDYYNKFGNVSDVASAWFTGHKYKPGEQIKDVYGTTPDKYVNTVLNNYKNMPDPMLQNFADKVDKSRQAGKTDTDILDYLSSKDPSLKQKISQSRSLYGQGKGVDNDRDLVNFLAQKNSGKMPSVPSVPLRGQEAVPQEQNKTKNESLLQKAGDISKEGLTAGQNLLVGAAKGLGSSILGASQLGQRLFNPYNWFGNKQSQQGIDLAQQAKEKYTTPEGMAQKAGFGAEQVAEFFAPGAAGVKGTEALKAAQEASTASKVLPKLLQFGTEAIPQIGVGSIQQGQMTPGAVAGGLLGGAISAASGIPTGEGLKESALQQYKQVLAPTKEYTKNLTEKVAPSLLDQGLMGISRKSLSEKIASKAAQAGQDVNTVIKSLPAEASINPQNVFYKLQELKNNYIVNGVVVEPEKLATIEAIQRTVADVGQSPTVESMRKLRQIYDKSVAQAKGYFGKTLAEGSQLEIKKEAANAIRKELSSKFPDLANVNAEYSLWKNAGLVLDETLKRQVGKGPSLGKKVLEAGTFAGELASGKGGITAFLGAKVMGALSTAVESTWWKSVSAVTKNRLANAIANGRAQEVGDILGKLQASFTSNKGKR